MRVPPRREGIPTRRLVEEFDEFAGPVFDQIGRLTLQNQKLKAARDLLLPRLMNGEIAV
jgi:type I restriction enzyme S subunit